LELDNNDNNIKEPEKNLKKENKQVIELERANI